MWFPKKIILDASLGSDYAYKNTSGKKNRSFIVFQKQLQEVFCEKGALRNFEEFTGKHLCQSLFLTKLQAWGLQLY